MRGSWADTLIKLVLFAVVLGVFVLLYIAVRGGSLDVIGAIKNLLNDFANDPLGFI